MTTAWLAKLLEAMLREALLPAEDAMDEAAA